MIVFFFFFTYVPLVRFRRVFAKRFFLFTCFFLHSLSPPPPPLTHAREIDENSRGRDRIEFRSRVLRSLFPTMSTLENRYIRVLRILLYVSIKATREKTYKLHLLGDSNLHLQSEKRSLRPRAARIIYRFRSRDIRAIYMRLAGRGLRKRDDEVGEEGREREIAGEGEPFLPVFLVRRRYRRALVLLKGTACRFYARVIAPLFAPSLRRKLHRDVRPLPPRENRPIFIFSLSPPHFSTFDTLIDNLVISCLRILYPKLSLSCAVESYIAARVFSA